MQPTSAVLLSRLAAGPDRSAGDELLRRHVDGMRRAAASAAGSRHADDAVQEACALVFAKAGLFRQPAGDDGEQAAGTWMRTIAANCALHLARADGRRRRHERGDPTMPAGPPSADAIVEAQEELAALREALADMPEKQRRPIVLRYFAGVESKAQLGAALGCSGSAAGVRLHRALERLRTRLVRVGGVLSLAVLLQRLEVLSAAAEPLDQAAAGSAALLRRCQDLAGSPRPSRLPHRQIIPHTENPTMRLSLATAALLLLGLLGWRIQASEPVSPSVPAPAPLVPQAQAAPPATVKDGIDAFSAALYRRLAAQPGNLAVSPFSVHAALAMTSAGARGETLAEMAQAASLPQQDALHAGWQDLARQLAAVPKGADGKPLWEWTMANALFGQRGQAFEAPFLALCKERYGAGLDTVDFIRDRAAAAKTINDWTSAQTAGRIPEIVQEAHLNEQTRLVLVNAMRLKAAWADDFRKEVTRPQVFRRPGAGDVQVPTMHQELRVAYGETPEAQIANLPFVGRKLSMVIIVPKAVDGLAALEAGLDGARLAQLAAVPGKAVKLVDLHLPRFRIAGGIVPLKEHLVALGMRRAFDGRPGQADFGGMVPVRPDYWLYVSEVLHRTFIEVDEKGCEAAAATAVVMDVGRAAPPAEQPVVLRADRPFLVLLRHEASGAILFMARVADPSAQH